MKRKRKRKDDTMKGENDLRRVEGAGAPDVPAPLCGVRIFDVLLRRGRAAKAAARVEWARWQENPEDMDALRRHVRLTARWVTLGDLAMRDLEERAGRFTAELNGEGRAA
jgi:hypothetical protein